MRFRRLTKKRFILLSSLLFFVIVITSNAQGLDSPDLSISESGIYFSKYNLDTGEEIAVYAIIHNQGTQADATVRFYLEPDRSLIGEASITVHEDSSTVACIHWVPDIGVKRISVSIEDVAPPDVDLSNNDVEVEVEFYDRPTVLEVKSAVATIEEGVERIIPIEVEGFQDLDDVDIRVIYQRDIDIISLSPLDIDAGGKVKFYLKIRAPFLEHGGDTANSIVLIQASNGEYDSNIAELQISIHPTVKDTSWWTASVATAAAGTLGAFAALGSTEVGKYKFISFLLPLYTKLKKDEILDHYIRGKIHGYILANPGDHYNSIKKALKISNSTFAYHLHVLEREGVIKSQRDGMYKRFYPCDMKLPSNGGGLKESQRLIVEKIKDTPGISQKDIAGFLGVSSSTVSYHVNELLKLNLIRSERNGMKLKYYVLKDELAKFNNC